MTSTSPPRRRGAAGYLYLVLGTRAPPRPVAHDTPRAWQLDDADLDVDIEAALAAGPMSDDDADAEDHDVQKLDVDRQRSLSVLGHMPPPGEFVHYYASDVPRRTALRSALPCDDGPEEGGAAAAVPWWRDVDPEQRGMCGIAKCFFRSLCDPARGYLVRSGGGDGHDGYDAAKELEERHGIKHLYAAPPFDAGASASRKFVGRLSDRYVAFYESAEEGGEGGRLTVQPTMSAPEGSTVVRCLGPRAKWLTGRLEQVLRGTNETAKERLVRDLEAAAEATRAEPRLITDFHLLVDPMGNAYHVGLDRVRRGWPIQQTRDVFEGCLEDAIAFVEALRDRDEDAKARLRERAEEWEERVYGTEAAAAWKGKHWRPAVGSARRKVVSTLRIYSELGDAAH